MYLRICSKHSCRLWRTGIPYQFLVLNSATLVFVKLA